MDPQTRVLISAALTSAVLTFFLTLTPIYEVTHRNAIIAPWVIFFMLSAIVIEMIVDSEGIQQSS